MPDIHSFCKDLKQGMEEYETLFKYYTKLLRSLNIPFVLAFRVVKDFYKKHKDWILKMIKEAKCPALIELLPERKHYWIIKHEYQYIDSVGGHAQLSTVQLDIEDSERYGIYYIDEKGEKKGCIIVHSSMGSIERFIYAILEEAAKAINEGRTPKIPTWLAPIQVRIIPLTSKYLDYALKIADKLIECEIRVDVDDREGTLSSKIRDAEKEWIPYIIVIGEKEVKENILTVRVRGEGIKRMRLEELIKLINEEIGDKPRLPSYTPILLSKRPKFA